MVANSIYCHRCRFTHDINAYLQQKPRDIKFSRNAESSDFNIGLSGNSQHISQTHSNLPYPSSVDPSTTCPVFEEKGECRYGLKCRFLGSHLERTDLGDLNLITDGEKVAQRKLETSELNYLPLNALKLLRSKKVCVRKFTVHCSCILRQLSI